MINLKVDYAIDASAMAVQASAAKGLIDELKQDPMGKWLELPEQTTRETLQQIKDTAGQIQMKSEYLVCIGIGGSYLGHRGVIEALGVHSTTKILYAGNSLSTVDFNQVLRELGDAHFSINVISKSGTTLEPAVAFRAFRQKLVEKYGEEEARKRIYITTDNENGILHKEAKKHGYKVFCIPDGVSGRYSVLTVAGLLPMAVAGLDIDELMEGARELSAAFDIDAPNSQHLDSIISSVCNYAAFRHIMRNRGYDTEIIATFEPGMNFFLEWWKQLFGESEGKTEDAIFPAEAVYTRDLHSLGQYMQQGRTTLFETFIHFTHNTGHKDVLMVDGPDNIDGLDYLNGKTLDYINRQAYAATVYAHSQHIPVLEVCVPDLTERSLGGLIYFFELACALSAKLQGVNPFDQPGVEAYKNKMFELLGQKD